jgi:hypothetical protein
VLSRVSVHGNKFVTTDGKATHGKYWKAALQKKN